MITSMGKMEMIFSTEERVMIGFGAGMVMTNLMVVPVMTNYLVVMAMTPT